MKKLLTEALTKTTTTLRPPVYGFRRHHQVSDLADGAGVLLQKADEWTRPLLVASLDVHKAFDALQPLVAAAAYLRAGAPRALVAAWLREANDTRAAVVCGPTPPTPETDARI